MLLFLQIILYNSLELIKRITYHVLVQKALSGRFKGLLRFAHLATGLLHLNTE